MLPPVCFRWQINRKDDHIISLFMKCLFSDSLSKCVEIRYLKCVCVGLHVSVHVIPVFIFWSWTSFKVYQKGFLKINIFLFIAPLSDVMWAKLSFCHHRHKSVVLKLHVFTFIKTKDDKIGISCLSVFVGPDSG